MLMINYRKNAMREHVRQVPAFNDELTVVREQCSNTFHNIDQVIDMRKYIQRDHEVRLATDQVPIDKRRASEECPQRRYTVLALGNVRDVLCRVDPEHLEAIALVLREEGAIIRSNLNHEAAWFRLDITREILQVLNEHWRRIRSVNIVAEKSPRIHDHGELHMRAIFAATDVQRKQLLLRVLPIRELVSQSRRSKIELLMQFATTEAAVRADVIILHYDRPFAARWRLLGTVLIEGHRS